MPHARSAARSNVGRLAWVLCLSLVILGIEIAGGVVSHSLALLADAAHVLTDAGGIGLALFTIWIGSRPASTERTFGYLRLEILAAAVNAVAWFGVAVFILVEAWVRIWAPPQVTSEVMLAVAAAGMVINSLSLWLLSDAQSRSLNLRAAYLEVMGDLAGSAAVIVAAAVIVLTGWERADAVASMVIALLILPRTWRLLRDATDVLLEATPKGVDLDDVRAHILEAAGVASVHDLHAWTITSGVNVVSAHVVLRSETDQAAVLESLSHCLAGHFDIEHSTFQLEFPDRLGLEDASHR
ncbi:MAG: cation diffusion facilitator family transporter [Candidatus Dormibacteria bacterium]